mgnify:FL=1
MIPQCKDFNNASSKLDTKIKRTFEPLVGKSHSRWGGCYYYKVGTRVTLHIGVNLGTTVRSKLHIMEEGFRPIGAISGWGGGADANNLDKSFIELYPDGEIWIAAPSKFALITVEFDVFKEEKEE